MNMVRHNPPTPHCDQYYGNNLYLFPFLNVGPMAVELLYLMIAGTRIYSDLIVTILIIWCGVQMSIRGRLL